jgi:hypothetical protein
LVDFEEEGQCEVETLENKPMEENDAESDIQRIMFNRLCRWWIFERRSSLWRILR